MEEPEVQSSEDAAADQETVIDSAVAPSTSLSDELAQLKAALEAAEAQSAQNLAGWQRAQATYENYRKRTEAERVEWTANANIILFARLLPVLDDFERAFTNLPEALRDEPWANGVRLIEQKLRHVLTLEGVEPIVIQPGDLFDPFFHQAILQQAVPGFAEGQIIAEVQRGYRLGQRVVRPAQVVVSQGLEEAAPTAAAPTEATPDKAE
ncbi:MAG: nucleotide exchange factor GrpE [Anaerolineae bacterium]|nr:nucleotide exchange factor GrpE [Anaerolineae bacterium]